MRLSLLWIDNIAPVEITPAQPLNQDLCSCRIGGKGDLILVTESFHLVDIVKAFWIGRITEEQDQINFVIGDP